MKKKLTVCWLAGMLIATLILSGCGGGNEPPVPAVQPETTPANSLDSSPSSEGDVAAILTKAKGIDEMYFEYVITDSEGNAEGKAWIKGSRSKNEMSMDGEAIISIYDMSKGEAYVYFAGEDMIMLSHLDPEMVGWFQTPANYYDDIDFDFVKIVDTGTIDGYKCKVMAIVNDQGEEETRMWVSEEYGIPLRIETTDEEGESIIEYKNLKVGSIPDDNLELPQGVEIMDMR